MEPATLEPATLEPATLEPIALAVRPVQSEQRLQSLQSLTEEAEGYIRSAKAEATLRAYRSDWKHFAAWCEEHGKDAMPASPETLCLYLVACSKVSKVATMQRRISSISQAHEAAGKASPTKTAIVRAGWQGLQKAKGVAQVAKQPAVTDILRRMVETLPEGVKGKRDRALLLLGFAGAFRRSEIVSLDAEDLRLASEGYVVTLRRSKTDQLGRGREVGIPYGSHPATCPVRALSEWLLVSGVTSGPLFSPVSRHGRILQGRLTAQSVALVVKETARAAGFDASRFGGHSLRSGLATAAAAAGAPERAIMAQTGHKSVVMVRRYVRHGSLFRENAAASVGL